MRAYNNASHHVKPKVRVLAKLGDMVIYPLNDVQARSFEAAETTAWVLPGSRVVPTDTLRKIARDNGYKFKFFFESEAGFT